MLFFSISLSFLAKVIRESMDKSVDPCYDFYEYACGKWSENNPIPEGETEWSLWDIIKRNIEEQIQGIVLISFPRENKNN